MGLPIVDDVSAPLGRRSRYALRVSVLQQCQLDCAYCRPGSVTTPSTKQAWLTPAEHARLAPLFFARGVEKVRFTGGEPTLRKDLVDVVAAWSSRRSSRSNTIALTTNGLLLRPLLLPLKQAGLDAITLHLDTLKPERVRALMGDGADVDVVKEAAAEARGLGFSVKWNVVVQRGRNDDELADFLVEGQRLGVEVRFIELMNTGSARGYVKEVFIAGREIVERLAAQAIPRRHASDPAALYVKDGVTFGVIASDTEPFCSECDRLRLSADGKVRGCLYQPGGLALAPSLRAGASDEALGALLEAALDDKRSHHPAAPVQRSPFSMADVGG